MNPTPRQLPRQRGFTLIELLTVIAIIGVLAAILIPVVTQVRNTARTSGTISNARQITQGLMMMTNENRGRLPSIDIGEEAGGQRFWPRRVADHLQLTPQGTLGTFLAPADRVSRRDLRLLLNSFVPTSYSGNPAVLRSHWGGAFSSYRYMHQIRRPSESIMIITGEPFVSFNRGTGESNGAHTAFGFQSPATGNNPLPFYNEPIAPRNRTDGFEQIGYYVGTNGRAIVDGDALSMPRDGVAIAGMVDGSVRRFRFGEILLRHVNVDH